MEPAFQVLLGAFCRSVNAVLIPSEGCGTSCAALSYGQPLVRGSVLSRFLQVSTLVFSSDCVESWLKIVLWLSRRCLVKSCYWTQSKYKVMKFYGLCHARDKVKWLNVQIIKLWLITLVFAEGKVIRSFAFTGSINALIVSMLISKSHRGLFAPKS